MSPATLGKMALWPLFFAVLLFIGFYPPAAFALPVLAFAWIMYLARAKPLRVRAQIAGALLTVMALTGYFLLHSNGDTSSLTPVNQPADYPDSLQGEP